MMKMPKPTHKMSRSSRVSPRRKEPLLKKPVHMSSSIRMSNTSSRGPLLKHPPPGIKRGLLMTPSSKGVHSSRMRPIASPPHRSVNRHSMHQSPVSMDRYHPFSYDSAGT